MTWRLSESAKFFLAAAVVLQILSMIDVVPPVVIVGFIALPWSTVPAIAALVAMRTKTHSIDRPGQVAALVLAAFVIIAGTNFAVHTDAATAGAVLSTGVVEEVAFRLGIPLVLLALLLKTGLRRSVALPIGLSVSAILFVALPGHIQQIDAWYSVTVFLAFAALMSYSVWRSGTLLPAIAAHVAIDYVTLLNDQGVLADNVRGLCVAAILISVVLLTLSIHEKVQEEEHDDVVIDLRDHVLANADAPGTPNALLRSKNN